MAEENIRPMRVLLALDYDDLTKEEAVKVAEYNTRQQLEKEYLDEKLKLYENQVSEQIKKCEDVSNEIRESFFSVCDEISNRYDKTLEGE